MPKKAASPKRGSKKVAAKKTKSKKASGVKRPTSAFMYFSIERRKQIVEADASLKSDIGGVAKKIGEEWRGLGQGQKQKYEALAAKDRQRYENEKGK